MTVKMTSTHFLTALIHHNLVRNKSSDVNHQKQRLNFPLPSSSCPTIKHHGTDGFPAEFYSHFWLILFPLFNRLLTKIKQNLRNSKHEHSHSFTASKTQQRFNTTIQLLIEQKNNFIHNPHRPNWLFQSQTLIQ